MLLYFRLLLCSLSYVHEYFALWSTQLIFIGTMQNNLWSELQDGDINRIQLIPRKLYAGVQMSVEQTTVHCVSKNDPTLKRYSSNLCGSISMTIGRSTQKALE